MKCKALVILMIENPLSMAFNHTNKITFQHKLKRKGIGQTALLSKEPYKYILQVQMY